VLAALGTARRIALDTVLPRRAPQRRRDLALALIVARLLEPAANPRNARPWRAAVRAHSLGEVLGSARLPPKRSMPHSTGWAASSGSSKPGWPAATSRSKASRSSIANGP
jgi:hypothetical protein